ncbi:hypothetical protein PN836_001090 [Ningiella sp. W23]|uniref:hypothetical protein n=1 Tax=Ningiella sp. W23 TaxID=3023715 RepID=UPI0037582534
MKYLLLVLYFTSLRTGAESLTFDETSDSPFHQELKTLIEKAYQELGYTLNYLHRPLKRSYREAELGRLSGLMGRVKQRDSAYENLIRVPVAVAKFNIVLLVNTDICSRCDLDNIERVATVSGFVGLQKAIDNQNLQLNLVEAPNRLDLFNLNPV